MTNTTNIEAMRTKPQPSLVITQPSAPDEAVESDEVPRNPHTTKAIARTAVMPKVILSTPGRRAVDSGTAVVRPASRAWSRPSASGSGC